MLMRTQESKERPRVRPSRRTVPARRDLRPSPKQRGRMDPYHDRLLERERGAVEDYVAYHGRSFAPHWEGLRGGPVEEVAHPRGADRRDGPGAGRRVRPRRTRVLRALRLPLGGPTAMTNALVTRLRHEMAGRPGVSAGDRLACVRAGSRSAVWAPQGGDGQKQVPRTQHVSGCRECGAGSVLGTSVATTGRATK